VFLLRHLRADGFSFWATPGGGVEGKETFEQAALREASEELGISGVPVTLQWEATNDYFHFGDPVRQDECFFLLDCDLPPLSGSAQMVHEQENVAETRWWAIAEIESSVEAIFPEDLASRLRGLVS
jgi:8-oxo-dGTP pyrophosphatase MutT (NUDIX family)